MKQYFLAMLVALSNLATAQSPYLLLGTYTGTGSKGIYVYRFNTATADAELVSTTEASNPSFLTVTRDGRFVYAVNEDDPGMVSAFAFDSATGKLRLLNQQPSNGKHPCYITTDGRGWYVFAGNYSSGNFVVYRTNNNDGTLQPAYQTIQHYGSSINKERQQGPHVHSTTFGTNTHTLYVTDLGTDRIDQYGFYWKDGLKDTTSRRSFKATPGSGPRHLAFHPTLRKMYMIEEMTGNVAVLKMKKNGKLKQIQRISAHPPGYTGAIGSADIHISPDGKFLYASNRGASNSLGIFSVDSKNGKLTWVGSQSTLGAGPRNFNFDPSGRYVLVANQNSNEVVIFERDATTGLLTDTGKRIAIPKPVCVAWVAPNP